MKHMKYLGILLFFSGCTTVYDRCVKDNIISSPNYCRYIKDKCNEVILESDCSVYRW